ncbi:hypothetical protein CURE108131_19975 [Cupriavidus respiraculi]|uniref:Uncharacterized protein n=1 Tax=Cupriavidus respiraculi TaxID=195930 RepID=A0ABM8XN53_9BURK|nr:hypothetical protein LMG21510_04362 [Cupriavidus respiraculi]
MNKRNSILIAGYLAVCVVSGSAVAMVAQVLPA